MLPGFVSLQIRTSGRGKFIVIHTFPISSKILSFRSLTDYEYKLYFLKKILYNVACTQELVTITIAILPMNISAI